MPSLFASPGALTVSLLASVCFIPTSLCATTDEWRSRSVYQVMTDRFAIADDTISSYAPCRTDIGPYCGGTWKGIMNNLDYIQGMNFDAIWMSPIVAQLPQSTPDGTSYASYWQQNLYGINNKFGSAQDLYNLIDAIHARGMYFMMDIVVNHMAYNGAVDEIDYSVLDPFNDQKYYHNYCEMDYSAKNTTSLEECWLGSWYVPLADLRTEDEIVQQMFGDWIHEMVSNYSVDGLRIDAGANVQPDFFTGFVESAGVFATTEVYLDNDTTACVWQETAGSILNYPIYWPLTDAFQDGGSISDLADMMTSQKTSCKDTTVLGTFSENHDVPRFANHTQDVARAKNVATFVLMSDGIPIIYQGQEQHFTGGTNPFTNREPLWETGLTPFGPLYQHIASLNTLRRHVISTQSNFTSIQTDVIHQDDTNLVMARGSSGAQVVTILTNAGSGASDSAVDIMMTDLGFKEGANLTDILYCGTYTVTSGGIITVGMSGGEPRVLYPTDLLSNSSLCSTGGERYSGNTTVTATTMTLTLQGNTTPTVMALTATMPAQEAAVTQASASPTSKTAGAARNMGGPSQSKALAVMTAVVLASGLAGVLVGFVS